MNAPTLTNLVPPPTPFSEQRPDWSKVESELGISLPSDYKRLAEAYDPGVIDEFLWVLHPSAASRHVSLLAQAEEQLAILRSLRDLPGWADKAVFPESGGVLPWGMTENGDVLYWRTAGLANQWTVTVNESRGPRWFDYDGTMEDFLVDVLTRRVAVPFFPRDFPSEHPKFRREPQPVT